jgi:hypothetical protein
MVDLPFPLGSRGGWDMLMTGRECALSSSALLLVLYILLNLDLVRLPRDAALAQPKLLGASRWDNWPRDGKDGRAKLLDIDEPTNSESCGPNTRRMAEHPCWISTSQSNQGLVQPTCTVVLQETRSWSPQVGQPRSPLAIGLFSDLRL